MLREEDGGGGAGGASKSIASGAMTSGEDCARVNWRLKTEIDEVLS